VGVSRQDGRQRLRDVWRVEGASAAEHFIEHHAERPYVRPPIGGPALRLFRGHVGRRADDETHRGHGRRRHGGRAGFVRRFARRGRAEGLGEAEVQHLDRAVIANFDVGWLQIAVDDAGLVGRFERLGDLPRDGHRFRERDGTTRHPSRQILTLDQFHDESQRLSLKAVNLGNVGVVQRGEGPGLAIEAPDPLGVARKRRRQDLDRDVSAELPVARAIDLAHAAAAKRRSDFIGSNAGAGEKRHGRSV
jgi:hypothetical protein